MKQGGLLIGSTADEVKAHVKTTWKRGGEAVELARAKLGDNADDLIPLRNGGVKLLKIRSTMNDTCATAKLSARKVAEFVEESGIEHYGENEWRALPKADTMVLEYLCGNHARGLPFDEFFRAFEKFLED